MKSRISLFIKLLIVLSICFSFGVTYYSKIILMDYDILENEDGPTLDE
jgi:hypothetical protein